MINNDLTYGRNFADFLGSFWSSIFDQGALGNAVGYASAEALVQIYMEMMDIINSSSVNTIPVFSRKNVYPVVISESKLTNYTQIPNYGDGAIYGPQPAGQVYRQGETLEYGTPAYLNASFFCPVTPVASLGSVAINRLFEPSVTLCNGSDFIYSATEGGIIFKTNPFANPLIPVNPTLDPTTGNLDNQIVLWFCDVDIDTYRIYNQYGFTFSSMQTSSEQYKEIVQNVFALVSQGPSRFRIDSFVSAIAGSPLIREVSETVEVVQNTPEGFLVITDKSVYSLSSSAELRSNVVVGAVLVAGTPLSNVATVVDTTIPGWWKQFTSLPLPPGSTTNTEGYLSFPNNNAPISYGELLHPAIPTSRSLSFSLAGDPATIAEFWRVTNEKAAQSQNFYGYELFQKYATSAAPATDFANQTQFFLNPAQVLAEDLCSFSILPITVNINNVSDLTVFFSTIDPIRKSIPVHVILMLFLNINLQDQYSLAASTNQTQTHAVDLKDLINVNFADFPTAEQELWTNPSGSGILEAVAINGQSFGILTENFDLSNASNLVQTIELRQTPICAT